MMIHDDSSDDGAVAQRIPADDQFDEAQSLQDTEDQAYDTEENVSCDDEASDEIEALVDEDVCAEDESEADTVDAEPLPEKGAEDEDEEAAPLDQAQLVRMVEAILFASADPVAESELKSRLPKGTDLKSILSNIQEIYEPRGVHLAQVAGKWAFRTANDLGFLLHKERTEQRRLTRAGIETLAIIAYHQPVTRAEIEQLRGVTVSKGTLDVLLDIGWVRMRGRRETPGRPLTYGTTDSFLEHFGLPTTNDLPGMEDLKAAGLLSWNLPPDFNVPNPPADGEGDGDGDFEEEEGELPFHREDAAAMTDDELFDPESDEFEDEDEDDVANDADDIEESETLEAQEDVTDFANGIENDDTADHESEDETSDHEIAQDDHEKDD
jgi:segregation and condensation protein B